MARSSLLHWLRWWSARGWEFSTADAGWAKAWFKYSNGSPEIALPFIMASKEHGFDMYETENGLFALHRVEK